MKETLAIIHEILDSKKAIDVRIIDISRISNFTNYFIICSGANEKHIQTLADELQKKLGEKGIETAHVEGYQNAEWVLLDYFDFIVHIFSIETREYYELERLWADGKVVDVRALP
ncbi:MAG TPA: ribosome silencing factor [Acidobacteriota bacterium]|nr:ribosome silencing factor [Acidobacteriota bacterium]HNR39516.1 ribosome silencing factor [Acidobacteriota bacterium]HNU01756.1 ribosome silencing factor [Acidobacteriota bacterium]HPB27796.1 ribosome silencing factor [Acidobacteriota bacterium]HQO25412.1 ribosome silencing factor [Acidobacteriota bacterium]